MSSIMPSLHTSSQPTVAVRSEKHCPLCQDLLVRPKLLPCGDLVCRHCLLSVLAPSLSPSSFSSSLSPPQYPDCPVCGSAIVETPTHPARTPAHAHQHTHHPHSHKTGGATVEEIVDGFPDDLLMDKLARAQHVLSGPLACCACANASTRGPKPAAVEMCLHCGDPFCAACATLHRNQPVTRRHKLEPLVSLTAEQYVAAGHVRSFREEEEEKEEEEQGEREEKLYCHTHGTTVCHHCAIANPNRNRNPYTTMTRRAGGRGGR